MRVWDDFLLKITRFKTSYDFLVDKNHVYSSKPTTNDFLNNIKNNCQDKYTLYYKNQVVLEYGSLQTVANYPKAHIGDTVGIGSFSVVCFVNPGVSFADPKDKNSIVIHGISNTKTIEGNIIDSNMMIVDSLTKQKRGRVLIHSTYYPPLDKETKAYSEACFIHRTINDINKLSLILRDKGVKAFDIIKGELQEV